MATRLFVTIDAVNKHLRLIRIKIGVQNNAEMLNALCCKNEQLQNNIILTPQRRKVFLLILQGFTSREIAEQLNITHGCVRKYRERMLATNNCTTTAQLIHKYFNGE